MKICLITPYYTPVKGGISSYISQLSKNLTLKYQETIIITKHGKKDAVNVFVAETNKIFFIIKALLIIRNFKPDILHSHAHWYVLAPCVIFKFFNPKTTLVHTFHTDPLNPTKGLKRIAIKILLSRCDVLTFVSKYLQDKIIGNYEINIKTKVIYGGVSLTTIDETEIIRFKKKFNLENHFPIISFVGVLSWKMKVEGLKILIKAFKQISKKSPDSRLLIVGDGEYRKEIEFLVKELGIASHVVFTGFVDNALIPLSACDIYAHISLQEGFPLAVLEAMSLGKPVIASRTGGIPEVIINGENGILTNSDAKEISDNLFDLIISKEKRSYIGNNARNTINKRFIWSIITENILDIYKKSYR